MRTTLIRCPMIMMVIFGLLAVTAVAAPTVDGEFDPEDEYDAEESQSGSYSTCWEYVDGNGDLYIFNDWDNPVTNYDPQTDDDYNIFTWDGVDNWRLKVFANCTCQLQKKVSGIWTDQADIDVYSNYTTTPGDAETNHPVWEIMIPAAQLVSTTAVNPSDPKNGGDSDPSSCGGGWNPVLMGCGFAPVVVP